MSPHHTTMLLFFFPSELYYSASYTYLYIKNVHQLGDPKISSRHHRWNIFLYNYEDPINLIHLVGVVTVVGIYFALYCFGCCIDNNVCHVSLPSPDAIEIIIIRDHKESLIVDAFRHMQRCGQIKNHLLSMQWCHLDTGQCRFELFWTFLDVIGRNEL